MAALFGCDHDYRYRFPGMQKEGEVAGQVIHTATDTGNAKARHALNRRVASAAPRLMRRAACHWVAHYFLAFRCGSESRY
jgi:hypothetical protein